MKKILLIDTYNLLYRSFYALKEMRNSENIHVGGIYGLCKTFSFLIKKFNPDYIYAFKDTISQKRIDIFNDYKKNRDQAPSELKYQKKLVEDFFKLINLNYFFLDGFEADDLIVNTAKKLSLIDNVEIHVVSADKDLKFLALNEKITIYDPLKNKEIKKSDLEKEFFENVTKESIWLYYALLGDASDGIPGISGIGKKTALELSKNYKNIENLYLEKTTHAKLIDKKKDLELFFTLIKPFEIQEEIFNFDFICDKNKWKNSNLKNAYSFFKKLEFNSLLPKDFQGKFSTNNYNNDPINLKHSNETFETIIYSSEKYEQLFNEINNSTAIAFDTETRGGDPRKNKCIGFSLCTNKSTAWYFTLILNNEKVDDFDEKILILEKIISKNTPFVFHNALFDLHVIYRLINKIPKVIFDTIIAAHIFFGNTRKIGLKELSKTILNEKMNDFSDIVEHGKYEFLDMAPIENVAKYAAADSCQTLKLYEYFLNKIYEEKNKILFDEIEMPLISVLFSIENNGIYCEKEKLMKNEIIFENELKEIKNKIIEFTKNKSFNPMSSKQVLELLFIDLKLISEEKTEKTKVQSTRISILEKLIDRHPIVKLIVRYRTLSSLLSRYIKGLSEYIEKDNRIHTHFQQMITATGRLSTMNPNLQNIPRDKDADSFSVRSSFSAPEEKKIISLDYSHVELRVLAHFSKDPQLIYTFENNIDIHKKTAAQIFEKEIEEVTKEERQFAKKINFGISYGMSAHGLSREIAITRTEAKKYLDIYKLAYSGMFSWMDSIIEKAEADGFVETLFKRKRIIPEIKDQNKSIKMYGMRIAVNTIIQGSAAEIMKKGMIEVYNFLKKENLGIMTLQIHDEILIEIDEKNSEKVAIEAKNIMENSLKLNVPLEVEYKIGNSWE